MCLETTRLLEVLTHLGGGVTSLAFTYRPANLMLTLC
jgi:hypothetical protein